ncbi:MAG: FtsX-like permease family protein [Verrucomicrobiota bacterium]
MANHSASEGFRAGIDVVAGKSHLEVRPATGPNLDETLLPTITQHPGIAAATPLTNTYVTLPNHPGEHLRIVGIDIFSNLPFLTRQIQSANSDSSSPQALNLDSWLADPDTIALSADLAQALKVDLGDSLAIESDGQHRTLIVGHLLSPNDSSPTESAAAQRTALMDIGWAQEFFQTQGDLASIQILLENPSQIESVRDALAGTLPDTVAVTTPSQRSLQIQRMLDGFRLNLLALSLVSILVGVFLIYNTVAASVVRRRREIGILRANGASRVQIMSLFLGEALTVGLIGIAIGIPGGILLGSAILGQVTQTVSNLYILIAAGDAVVPTVHIFTAAAFGLFATLAGAWLPALEAARTNTVQVLHPGSLVQRSQIHTPRLAIAGFTCAALAIWSSYQALQSGPPSLSFLSCFLVITAFSLLVPLFCRCGGQCLGWALRHSRLPLLTRVATENFTRSLHRNGPTVAALMAAIAMMIGVSVMVSSFRNTVAAWVNQTMIADIYVGPAANQTIGLKSFIPASLTPTIASLPGITGIDSYRELPLILEDEKEYVLAVVDASGSNFETLDFIGGDNTTKRKQYQAAEHVIVTEPLATKSDIKTNDTLTLPTPNGSVSFTVAGIAYDYLDDRGRLMMTRENFNRHWDDPRVHSIALYLDDPNSIPQIETQLRSQSSPNNELAIFSNRALRDRVFEIFNQTFAITFVLRTIAIIVAAIGIVLSLTTLVMERRRDIAVWRSLGAGRRQIAATTLTEAALIGFFASVIGILCGLAMAMVLTWVVNKAFFGWTIRFEIPLTLILYTPLWVILTALAAALFPANQAAKLPLAQSLRTE